jgi:hypothetical protein
MRRTRLRAVLRLALALGLAASAVALLPAPTQADTPISLYAATPGNAQAGGHPDVEIFFEVENRVLQRSQSACNCEDVKDATVHFPAGFIGNPHATPQCTVAEFSAEQCPIDSQVGIVNVFATNGIGFNSALYNLVPPPDVAGLLGFKVILLGAPQFTILSARTGGDYGLDAAAVSIYHGDFPLQSYQEDVWGVPADPIHDRLRLNPEFNPNGKGFTSYVDSLCNAEGAESSISDPNTIVRPCIQQIPPAASHSPRTPFLQDPTNCEAGLSATLEVLSYDGGVTHATDPWPQMTGCSQLAFNPSLFAQPTTAQTDSASGMEVNLNVPQELSPTIPAPTELRSATLTLPEAFSINANAADGKVACSDAEANFGTTREANCPEFAKIGSLTILSSALPAPLPGFVYLGEPLPGDRYRVFLVANGFATHIKLVGTATPNPQTGQLTITFNELPQSPLTAFNMHIFGSERGLLATPTRCGTYPVTSTFTPWDASLGSETSTQYFTLTSGPFGGPCPGERRPFSPTFQGGSANHTPGGHASFSFELIRPDGDQNLTGLTVKLPRGFSATLAGVPYCSDAALARAADPNRPGLAEIENPSCPAASQIGTAVSGAGAGTHPLYTPGKVYLAGPYKGAPLSLAAVVPAVSGPYDLGDVVVRAAIHVDPFSAQITTVSDPLPQILQGIPLRLRSLRVDLNRPNFTINPTDCNPFAIEATASANEGAVANLSQPFQVANCASLPFEPKLSLRLTGSTKHAGNPALHSLLTAGPGEAGIARAVVALPHTEFLDNAHIQSPCTRAQFAAHRCPPGSVIGFARAVTPLLEKPLEGPVYLMSGFGHKLPDVVADLKGQIEILLDGKVDTVHGGLRTTFETVPDAPVTKFSLSLKGGSKGLLENSEPICHKTQVANVKLAGQNGRNANSHTRIQTPCNVRHRRHLRRARAVR